MCKLIALVFLQTTQLSYAYIGTQPDKLAEAISGMNTLLTELNGNIFIRIRRNVAKLKTRIWSNYLIIERIH